MREAVFLVGALGGWLLLAGLHVVAHFHYRQLAIKEGVAEAPEPVVRVKLPRATVVRR